MKRKSSKISNNGCNESNGKDQNDTSSDKDTFREVLVSPVITSCASRLNECRPVFLDSNKGPKGTKSLLCGYGHTVRSMARITGQWLWQIDGERGDTVTCILLIGHKQKGGPYLVVGMDSGEISLWNIDTRECLSRFRLGGPVLDIASASFCDFMVYITLGPSDRESILNAGVKDNDTENSLNEQWKVLRFDVREGNRQNPSSQVVFASPLPILGVVMVATTQNPSIGGVVAATKHGLHISADGAKEFNDSGECSPVRVAYAHANYGCTALCARPTDWRPEQRSMKGAGEATTALATGHADGQIHVWFGLLDPEAGHFTDAQNEKGKVGGVYRTASTHRRKEEGKEGSVIPPPRGVRRITMHWHSQAVHALCWSSGGYLLSGGTEATLTVWRMGPSGDAPPTTPDFLPRLGGTIVHLAASSDGLTAAVATTNNVLRVVSIAERTIEHRIRGLALMEPRHPPPSKTNPLPPPVVQMLAIEPPAGALAPERPGGGAGCSGCCVLVNGQPGTLQWFDPLGDKVSDSLQVVSYNYICRSIYSGVDEISTSTASGSAKDGQEPKPWPAVVLAALGVEVLVTVDCWEHHDDCASGVTATERKYVQRSINLKFWQPTKTGSTQPWSVNSSVSAPHGTAPVTALALAEPEGSDSPLVATGAADGSIRVWTLVEHATSSNTSSSSKGGGAGAGLEATMVWICAHEIAYQTTHPVSALALSPDASVLASSHGVDGFVALWAPRARTLLTTLIPPPPAPIEGKKIRRERALRPSVRTLGFPPRAKNRQGGGSSFLSGGSAASAPSRSLVIAATDASLCVWDVISCGITWCYKVPVKATAVLPHSAKPLVLEDKNPTIAAAVEGRSGGRAVVLLDGVKPEPALVWNLKGVMDDIHSLQWAITNDGRPCGVIVLGAKNNRRGDWLCPSCDNMNNAYRKTCNRCDEPRTAETIRAETSTTQTLAMLWVDLDSEKLHTKRFHGDVYSKSESALPLPSVSNSRREPRNEYGQDNLATPLEQKRVTRSVQDIASHELPSAAKLFSSFFLEGASQEEKPMELSGNGAEDEAATESTNPMPMNHHAATHVEPCSSRDQKLWLQFFRENLSAK